jgi:hypothetical protein
VPARLVSTVLVSGSAVTVHERTLACEASRGPACALPAADVAERARIFGARTRDAHQPIRARSLARSLSPAGATTSTATRVLAAATARPRGRTGRSPARQATSRLAAARQSVPLAAPATTSRTRPRLAAGARRPGHT